jgi:hypothetical protein
VLGRPRHSANKHIPSGPEHVSCRQVVDVPVNGVPPGPGTTFPRPQRQRKTPSPIGGLPQAEAYILLFRTSQNSLPEILRGSDPPSPSLIRLNSGFALHIRGR